MLAMGEVGGAPVAGFDFGNSPSQLVGLDLAGRRLVQRTSAGTQGVVRSERAELILASSFCNACATAEYLQYAAPDRLTFVITGLRPGGWGDEDAACADYIAAQLRGESPDPEPYLERVRDSAAGRLFGDPAKTDFPSSDLEYCLAVDRFDFAMRVRRAGGRFILEPVIES
jgi:2-phosphosulfolactate phosphatase